jgi:opacity protein-like surface antigen
MLMKRLFLSAATAAVVLGAAPMAQAHEWTGLYLGVQAGMTYGEVDQPFAAAHGGPTTGLQPAIDISGGHAGVHVGYDQRLDPMGWDALVIGVVAEYSSADGDGYDNGGINAAFVTAPTEQNQANIDTYMDASLRLGWLVLPSTMIYGKVGYALIEGDYIGASPPRVEKVGIDWTGTVYGIGTEFRVGQQFNLGFEWKIYDVDAQRQNMSPRAYDVNAMPEMESFELRLSYRFDEF